MTIRLSRLALAAPFALMLLTACAKQELYSQLSERQANEMIAVLKQENIDAEKQVRDGQFAIATAPGDFAKAVQVLSAKGYPKESYDSMGKVFKREGFVSSPLEERARLLHAMSQEISNTLTNIDGVITARVHLVVPEKNPLADKAQPAAAAVFIKHRPDRNLSDQITQIKALVVNSIEGLAYDNVTVALFPAESIPVDGPRVTATTAPRNAGFGIPLVAGTLAGTLALAGGGLMWWRRRDATPEGGDATRAPAHADNVPQVADDINALLRRVAGHK